MNQASDRMVVNARLDEAWQLGAFRISAESRAADGRAGGDFYAVRARGPNRLAVVIGDACGRGADGARLLPEVLPLLDELSFSVTQPSALLRQLNRRLAEKMALDRFITSAILEIDAARGTFTLSNAGHVPALLRHRAGEVVVVGRASGPPLGVLADSDYEDESHPFADGDVLVFMTDGVLEAVESDLTAMPRLAALVGAAGGGVRDVHSSLLASLAVCQAERRADDMTLLSLELVGEAALSTPEGA